MWVNGIITGDKQEVIDALGANLEEDKRYEVIIKEKK